MDVRTWTLEYALLPWIKAINAKDTYRDDYSASKGVTSFWRETVQSHLRHNAKQILESYQKAAAKSNKQALRNALKLIEPLLRTKGFLE